MELVRAFDWRAAAADLDEKPALLAAKDERGRNWLHICCMTKVEKDRSAADSIKTAKMLLARGLGLNEPAFTEGAWKATPLWHAIAFGQNLKLAEFLLDQGSIPHHCLYAAIWNNDYAAIRLLVARGADIEEGKGENPVLGAIKWSRFPAAEELLKLGGDPNRLDPKGMTALHYMLKKGSPVEAFEMMLRYGARTDIPDAEGRTAAEIISRKRDPAFRALAKRLA
jgi:hypothetical protein